MNEDAFELFPPLRQLLLDNAELEMRNIGGRHLPEETRLLRHLINNTNEFVRSARLEPDPRRDAETLLLGINPAAPHQFETERIQRNLIEQLAWSTVSDSLQARPITRHIHESDPFASIRPDRLRSFPSYRLTNDNENDVRLDRWRELDNYSESISRGLMRSEAIRTHRPIMAPIIDLTRPAAFDSDEDEPLTQRRRNE